MRSSAAPRSLCRQWLPSTHEPVVGVAEPHDRRAGATRLSDEVQAFVAGRPEGLPALLAVGARRAWPAHLWLIPQRWSAPYCCWARERTVRQGCAWRPRRPAPTSRSSAWTPARTRYQLVGGVLALSLAGIARRLCLLPEVLGRKVASERIEVLRVVLLRRVRGRSRVGRGVPSGVGTRPSGPSAVAAPGAGAAGSAPRRGARRCRG